MFLDNKYARWYQAIVDNARSRLLEGYSEEHHVIPQSLNGSNDQANLVVLTAREHFVVHWLLTKMVSEPSHRQKMFHALAMMMTDRDGNRGLTARQYEVCKKARSAAMTGHVKSEETRRKLSEAKKGKPRDEATKRKISESLRGKKQSSETVQKRLSKTVGQTRSEETKKRISEAKRASFAKRRAETGQSYSDETRKSWNKTNMARNKKVTS